MQSDKASVGVFGIGLVAYWPQFEGLKERLEGYQRDVEERISELPRGVRKAPPIIAHWGLATSRGASKSYPHYLTWT